MASESKLPLTVTVAVAVDNESMDDDVDIVAQHQQLNHPLVPVPVRDEELVAEMEQRAAATRQVEAAAVQLGQDMQAVGRFIQRDTPVVQRVDATLRDRVLPEVCRADAELQEADVEQRRIVPSLVDPRRMFGEPEREEPRGRSCWGWRLLKAVACFALRPHCAPRSEKSWIPFYEALRRNEVVLEVYREERSFEDGLYSA